MKLNVIVMSITLLIICMCIAPSTADLSNTAIAVSNSSNTPDSTAFSGSSYSGENATVTTSGLTPRYEKPVVHIISPKTSYSSPLSGKSEKFQVPGGSTIPLGKQNTLIDKNNLTESQKKLTTALLLVSDPSVKVASRNNNEIQLSLITRTVPLTIETPALIPREGEPSW